MAYTYNVDVDHAITIMMDMSLKDQRANPKINENQRNGFNGPCCKERWDGTFSGAVSEKSAMGGSPLVKQSAKA